MKTMLLQKIIPVALIAALALAAFPMTGVSAANQPAPQDTLQSKTISNERLESIWARMNRRYERFEKFLDKSDGLVEKANRMLERLEQAGEPTAELEAALGAFEEALKEVHPIFESTRGIINAHKGFDSEGKVTDAELAKETIKDLGGKLGEMRLTMDGTGRELIDLMRSIAEAHRPVTSGTDPE